VAICKFKCSNAEVSTSSLPQPCPVLITLKPAITLIPLRRPPSTPQSFVRCSLVTGRVRSRLPLRWRSQRLLSRDTRTPTSTTTTKLNRFIALHHLTKPAIMAKTPQQSNSRKRKRAQDDAVAAMPLRRSRRVAYRETFRFNDLPPELRNMIYSMALRDGQWREVCGKLSAAAKAFSQISRTVRTESLSIYFAENNFDTGNLIYWSTPDEAQQEISKTEKWLAFFGKLAAPHIHALPILHGNMITVRRHTIFFHNMRHKQFPPSGGPVKLGTPIVLDHGDDFFEEYRALVLARVAKEGERFYWARASDTPTQDLGSTHSDILAVARLRPHGDIGYKVETLRLLLIGVQQMVEPHITQDAPRLTAAALLSHLE
jgi:hypothetical protein